MVSRVSYSVEVKSYIKCEKDYDYIYIHLDSPFLPADKEPPTAGLRQLNIYVVIIFFYDRESF